MDILMRTNSISATFVTFNNVTSIPQLILYTNEGNVILPMKLIKIYKAIYYYLRNLFRHILSKQVFEMSMLVFPLVQNPSLPTSRSFPK